MSGFLLSVQRRSNSSKSSRPKWSTLDVGNKYVRFRSLLPILLTPVIANTRNCRLPDPYLHPELPQWSWGCRYFAKMRFSPQCSISRRSTFGFFSCRGEVSQINFMIQKQDPFESIVLHLFSPIIRTLRTPSRTLVVRHSEI